MTNVFVPTNSLPFFVRTGICLLLAFFGSAAGAIAPSKQDFNISLPVKSSSIGEQRRHYELAKEALNKDDTASYNHHYGLLGDYPLTPYLDYASIKQSLFKLDFDKIDKFLESNRDSFLETRLRQQLLYTLAVKKRWHEYLVYYEALEHATTELRCYANYAHLTLPNESELTSAEAKTKAMERTAKIWQKGKSQPKSCDPLFRVWRKNGGITQEIAWTRFTAAMDNNKRGLARYITSFFDEKYQAYSQLYMRVHGYPYTIRKRRQFSEQSLEMQQIIAHGIQRYSRHNPKDALYQWEFYEAQQLFPFELSTDTKRYVVKRLLRKGHYDIAENLINRSEELQDTVVLESFVRESLKTQQWDKVVQWIKLMDDKARSSDRWRYWYARAQSELGLAGPLAETPATIYTELAQNRSFYGFLASDILRQSYSLEHIPIEISPSTLHTVEALPAVRRIKELWMMGNLNEAKAEWVYSTKKMDTRELAAAGQLARQWGWYHKGIRAMILGNLWDHLNVRFPLAYKDVIHRLSEDTQVDVSLIYAVARQESAFAEYARSSAGAMGLMQLMPGTAKQTARKSGIRYKRSDLYDPERNMTLGSRYLSELLRRYDGNRILAAAAYNAGPHRVKRWTESNDNDVPFDVWIETIPFKETRGYVQNILSYSVIYGYRLGKPSTLVTEKEAKSLL